MTKQVIQEIFPVAGKNTVSVHTGELEFEIAASEASRLDLQTGMPLTTALHKQLEAAAHRRAAAAQALKFLNGRPRTEYEVRHHLLDSDHSDLAVTAVVEDLRVERLVNDERYAQWYVQARLAHRPTGVARLVHEMGAKGVSRELAQSAAEAAVVERDEVTLATQAAEKRMPGLEGLDRERAMRRLSSFLVGRGFRAETVRTVCVRLLAGHSIQEPSGHLA